MVKETPISTSIEPQSKSENQLIGKVIRVSADNVGIQHNLNFGEQLNPTDHNLKIGTFIIIPGTDYISLGQITELKTISSEESKIQTEVIVQLLLSIQLKTAKVIHGIIEQPQIGANAIVATAEILKLITNPAASASIKESPVSFLIANLQNAINVPVAISPETLFGRHCAIIGTTGAGKSWTIARILEEAARYNSKIILFDATGEYQDISTKVRHVYLGNDPEPALNSQEVVLPFYNLTENDLFAIFQPNGESQAPKLRAAIKSLKLANLKPEIAISGKIIKANRSKLAYENAYQQFAEELEKNGIYFEIDSLARQIENECVIPVQSSVESNSWGAIDPTDRSACVSLVSRMEEMLRSDTLAPIFRPQGKKSLLTEIEEFLKDDSSAILRISLQYLSYDHHARELITNAAGRYLLNLARKNYFKQQPTLILLDEAHQFLNLEINNEDLNYALDSFAILAKEGRKYGVNLCIATQRPRDIPEGVISQMGTLIVHRLINDYDRSLVERACGQLDHRTVQMLPNLTAGEAILVGAEFPIPLMIKVIPARCKPNSAGPDYQNYWK